MRQRLAVLATLLSATALACAAPAAAKPPAAAKSCFWPQSVSGYRTLNDRVVNVRVGVKDVSQFEMLGPCPDLDWSESIALVSRGAGQICSGMDADIITPSSIGPRRCAVRNIHKLTPAEVTALPKSSRP